MLTLRKHVKLRTCRVSRANEMGLTFCHCKASFHWPVQPLSPPKAGHFCQAKCDPPLWLAVQRGLFEGGRGTRPSSSAVDPGRRPVGSRKEGRTQFGSGWCCLERTRCRHPNCGGCGAEHTAQFGPSISPNA